MAAIHAHAAVLRQSEHGEPERGRGGAGKPRILSDASAGDGAAGNQSQLFASAANATELLRASITRILAARAARIRRTATGARESSDRAASQQSRRRRRIARQQSGSPRQQRRRIAEWRRWWSQRRRSPLERFSSSLVRPGGVRSTGPFFFHSNGTPSVSEGRVIRNLRSFP
jgi:hypothetical protein